MPEIIREEETLAMKLRVHDDIGHSILAARRVLLPERGAGGASGKRGAVGAVHFAALPLRTDDGAGRAAGGGKAAGKGELGVSVLLTGDEPQAQRIRALCALAICECAANCVRHADGTELYVSFARRPGCTEVSLPTTARRQKKAITEGGGLSMLRHRIEESGGRMELQASRAFS